MASSDLVSVLIPTYNEAENIAQLLKRLIQVLDNCNTQYEVLVIDDASFDNTAALAQKVLVGKGRLIRRISYTRSLSLSILDGLKQAKGNIVIVMDGDGSHPPELIPRFIEAIKEGYGLVIGSRYIEGGGTEYFPLNRKIISRIACFIGKAVTEVRDNTSGFFCIRKEVLQGINLTPYGFKIGLEVFVKANFGKFKEIPFIFVNRKKGKSKLNTRSILEYLFQVFSLFVYQKSKGHGRR